MEILIFLKEISSVLLNVLIFGGIVFFLWGGGGKNYHFIQKVLVLGQMSDFWSTVIKSCCANFRTKGQWCLSISISGQKCEFWPKNWKIGRNADFIIKCALILKVIIFWQNMLIFRKIWLFVWMFININKVSNSDKNFNFS